jgi:hypothetical protein
MLRIYEEITIAPKRSKYLGEKNELSTLPRKGKAKRHRINEVVSEKGSNCLNERFLRRRITLSKTLMMELAKAPINAKIIYPPASLLIQLKPRK